jgi:transposase-like protein
MRKILDWLVWKTRLIRVFEWLSNVYWTKRNRVMICCECGFMVIPDASLPNEYGWRKMRNPNRWICHHCFDHFDDPPGYGFSPKEWAEYVIEHNNCMRKTFSVHNFMDLPEYQIEE